MSAPEISIVAAPDRQANFARWRRRSRLVRTMRVVLPVLIALVLAGLVGAMIYNALNAAPSQPRDTNAPITLVKPRFSGRDDKGRPFVITAMTATRDPRQFQRVLLDRPTLDMGGPQPLHGTALKGIYMESTSKLYLSGAVHLVDPRGVFDTASSILDTKTGEVAGSDPVHGRGPLGEIRSEAYAVHGKGEQIEFMGAVRSRFNVKK